MTPFRTLLGAAVGVAVVAMASVAATVDLAKDIHLVPAN
jgi:hypothetical protein